MMAAAIANPGMFSGGNIMLPGAVLRSAAIELMGSGIGSIPLNRLMKVVAEVLQSTIPGGFAIAAKAIPLSQVEEAWYSPAGLPRIVFVS
jgi:hypothetical protein